MRPSLKRRCGGSCCALARRKPATGRAAARAERVGARAGKRMNLPCATIRRSRAPVGQRLPARATGRQTAPMPSGAGFGFEAIQSGFIALPLQGAGSTGLPDRRFALHPVAGRPRPDGARPGKRGSGRHRPAGGRACRSARQAGVRFGDDFAVLEVECPGFCEQLAHACEPASGFGGTVGGVRRLHDKAPLRWRVRDNPNHSETPPLCEMRFRYMRITDI
ncbi:hypothetical protein BME24068_05504 [Burkholderia metallica]|nr:hypothetical protein BME24068_05504 [Burkholderia metallica]